MDIQERNHLDITYIQIVNKNGLDIVLSTSGASIYWIKFHNECMTLTPKFLSEFENIDYHGKIIGRVAGRIKDHKILINGKEYILQDNEDGITLHGGINSLSKANYSYRIKKYKNGCEIIFSYISKDLDAGFPGTLEVNITYRIYDDINKIQILFDANTDKDTVINLSNHPYFSLGSYDVNDLYLTFPASSYIKPDPKTLLPLDKEIIVSCLDFRKEKCVGKMINDTSLAIHQTQGYDHYLCFDNPNNREINLRNNKFNLLIKTSYPGAQIYTDNALTKEEFIDTDSSINHRGIAIEPSLETNEQHILNSGEKYHHYISYLFLER